MFLSRIKEKRIYGVHPCSEFGVRSSEFGVPDHAMVLWGNANRILVTIGIND